MKWSTIAFFLLPCIMLTSLMISCGIPQDNESNGEASIIVSSDTDDYHTSLDDTASKSDNSTSWEIPEDIENPSQGLELAESYSKEHGDCYVVVGIGTCEDTDIVIPSTVNGMPVLEIADRAFYQNNRIKSIYCGNRVTKIGKQAFQECKNLKKVVIPDSVTMLCEQAFAVSGVEDVTMSDRITAMERAVFTGCESLKRIKLPPSLTVIPDQTFAGCSSLVNVELPPNTTSISYRAFVKTALKTITLPASVESIDPSAFVELPLQSIKVSEDNPYFCSVDGVLFSKDMSTIVAYPQTLGNYIVPEGVKTIDNGAFFREAYTSFEVSLPESIRTIGSSAFTMEYSGSLTVNIKKGLSHLDDFAFDCPMGNVMLMFEGTKEEWNAIGKSEHWYLPYEGFGNQKTTVQCSDGTLTFNYDPGY